ncbi:MAG: DUF2779 domain-containing protein [Pyrinomonadaceae bacterium]
MQPKSKMDFRLTKTAYLDYLKCPAEFWLSVREPLLVAEPITLEHEHLRQQGYAVENLVRKLERFQANDEIAVDFQRTFQTDKLLTRSDVVVTDKLSGEIEIFEIKSSTQPKPEHYDDVAFQKIAAERSGSRVGRTHLITMNGAYVRRGDIDVEQLFTVTDITEKVDKKLADTEDQIKKAFDYLMTVPVPSLVDYCIANKLDCRFIKLHFPELPEYTVFDISYLKHDKRRKLLSDGVIDIRDVPEDFSLSDKQRRQVDAAKTGAITIDRDEIARRVCEWKYPLHFLDYETFAYAIPQFEGVKPFQQMCFQYSLHTIDRPGGEVRHSEYLSRGHDDPPRAVAEHLRNAMSGGIGTVFVWYEAFEKGRNDEMAEMFPDLAEFFSEVNYKTCDLMNIFADDLYIHPQFKGKTSIKKVLPVLVPSLSYTDLGINDGLAATIKWFRAATWNSMSDAERQQIFNDLLEYCELDTVAMLEIFKVLVSLKEP